MILPELSTSKALYYVFLCKTKLKSFGIFFKSIGLLVVLVAALASHPGLALAAALTYALAYTLELGLSLLAYYGRTP